MADTEPLLLSPYRLRLLIDYDPETGILTWKPRGQKGWDSRYAGTPALEAINSGGYRSGFILGRSCKAHRVAWAIHYGAWPEGEIDHINGDPADNRVCNLREVSKSLNARNRSLRSDNPSGFVGVSADRNGKWRARIHIDGRERSLGSFKTPEEAAEARRAFALMNGYTTRHEGGVCG